MNAAFSGKVIALSVHIKKLERSHSNSLLLHVISLENKMKQKLLKSTIWEEIIKIGSISRAKNFQTISRIMK